MASYKNGEFIYKKDDQADNIFILLKGSLESVVINIEGDEKIVEYINEPNSIFGEIETILSIPRETSVRVIEDAEINVIQTKDDTLKKTILTNPKLGLNISIRLACAQKEINERLNLVNTFSEKVKSQTDKFCLNYYDITKEIDKSLKKYRFDWLKKIADFSKNNIIYQIGKSVNSGQDYIRKPVNKKNLLSFLRGDSITTKGSIVFEKGQILCNEGAPQNEMFILMDGKLDVFIGQEKVAEIKDKGSIFGEIAVILGYVTKQFEPRTATVKAATKCLVIVIPGKDLEPVMLNDPNLILHTCSTLASRLPNTYNKYLESDLKLKKCLSLLNPISITGASIPVAFKSLSETFTEKSNVPEITSDLKEKSEIFYSESKQSFNDYNNKYSSVTGTKFEKIKDIEEFDKELEAKKKPEIGLPKVREVYEKIVETLGIDDELVKKKK